MFSLKNWLPVIEVVVVLGEQEDIGVDLLCTGSSLTRVVFVSSSKSSITGSSLTTSLASVSSPSSLSSSVRSTTGEGLGGGGDGGGV